MNNEQLRETLTARRAEFLEKISERNVIMKDLAAENRIALARVEEITYALEALDDLAPAKTTAPAEKPKEPSPRDAAAWAILNAYSEAETIPDDIDALPAAIRDKWNPRTLRAAINIAHIKRNESRAATESGDSPGKEIADLAPSNSAPDGAGDPLDMPGFLRREKSDQPKAAE